MTSWCMWIIGILVLVDLFATIRTVGLIARVSRLTYANACLKHNIKGLLDRLMPGEAERLLQELEEQLREGPV